MTEPQSIPADETTAVATPPGQPDDARASHDETAEASPGSEAARYRVRAREAEAERDALAARIEQMQRARVAELATHELAVGGDLLEYADVQLHDLLNEAGDVDPAKVTEAANALLQVRPGLGHVVRRPDPHQGRGGPVYGTPIFADAFRRR